MSRKLPRTRSDEDAEAFLAQGLLLERDVSAK